MKNRIVILFFSLIFSSGCFLQKPIKVEKEYYASGRIKIKHYYYKRGDKVKYFSDHKTRTKTRKGKILLKQKEEK